MSLPVEVLLATPVLGALVILLGRVLWNAGSALRAYTKWRAEK